MKLPTKEPTIFVAGNTDGFITDPMYVCCIVKVKLPLYLNKHHATKTYLLTY